MVASGALIDFWRAAEFGVDDDESVIEHSAAGEILEEGCKGGVECRGQRILHLLEILAVGVPRALRRMAIADIDQRDSRLGQAPGEQAALAELRLPVRLAQLSRFRGQVEGLAHPVRSEQGKGL